MRASTSPTQVSSGTTSDKRETAGHDQPSHRVEPHRPQCVDLLGHFHRGDLRGKTRTRSAGHDDRGDQRPQLAEMCDDHELGNVGDRAEAAELRDAEKSDDDADQQIGGARDEAARPRRSPGSAAVASASRPSAVTRTVFGSAAAQRPAKSSASLTWRAAATAGCADPRQRTHRSWSRAGGWLYPVLSIEGDQRAASRVAVFHHPCAVPVRVQPIEKPSPAARRLRRRSDRDATGRHRSSGTPRDRAERPPRLVATAGACARSNGPTGRRRARSPSRSARIATLMRGNSLPVCVWYPP